MSSELYNRTQGRQSNFELLRILAMILIVAHHFSVHGGFSFSTQSITINRLWIQFIQIGGGIGVNIFIFISGYFLFRAQSISIRKVLKLWLQLFFYSVLIYLIFVAAGLEKFSLSAFMKCLLPVTYENWWFASTYFILYLIFPFINILLKALDKKTYQKMLILLTVCWCIILTITNQELQSNNLLWFIYIYSISIYIYRYNSDTKIKGRTYLLLAVSLIILTFLSAVLFDILGLKIGFFGTNATAFYRMQCLPVLLISLFLFLGFKNIDIKHNKFINLISSATFGVYLIHDNPLIRSFLWLSLCRNSNYQNSSYLIPYSIAMICLVYIVCTVFELARIYLLENQYMKLVNKLDSRINNLKSHKL